MVDPTTLTWWCKAFSDLRVYIVVKEGIKSDFNSDFRKYLCSDILKDKNFESKLETLLKIITKYIIIYKQ